MLRRCSFGGVEFDCCERAVTSCDEDGICFQLALNMDSDNAKPADGTVHQRDPGPAGGLSVEVSLETRDFPWLDDDAQNGFRILVGHTPLSIFSQPVVAPHAAETFVKVIPEKHVLSAHCAPWNKLRVQGEGIMYYDPEGTACAATGAIQLSMKYGGCQMASYLYRPNSTIVCPPIAAYGASVMLVESDLMATLSGALDDPLGISKSWATHLLTKLEDSVHTLSTNKGFCPKHCQYWTYFSTASFFYLENGTSEMEHSGRMYSKIHVYYGSLSYRQHSEEKKVTTYLAFCDFGNVVGLYWGMSIVSFFHVFYYVPRYLYARRRKSNWVEVTPVIALSKRGLQQ